MLMPLYAAFDMLLAAFSSLNITFEFKLACRLRVYIHTYSAIKVWLYCRAPIVYQHFLAAAHHPYLRLLLPRRLMSMPTANQSRYRRIGYFRHERRRLFQPPR